MNKTNFTLGVLATLLLTACGGGGSTASPPSKVASYAGVWVGTCDGHTLFDVTFRETAGVKDTLTLTSKTEYYAQTGCTGAVVATETYTADVTAVFLNSIDAGVVFTPGSASVTTKIDNMSLSMPDYRHKLSGSGVTPKVYNGEVGWCVAYGDRSSTCFKDELMAGSSAYSRTLYVSANKLYMLEPSASQYSVTSMWTRK